MIATLAFSTSIVVLTIAGLHLSWAFGGVWPGRDPRSLARTVVGTRGIRRMPSRAACVVVATVLTIVGLWPLFAWHGVGTPWVRLVAQMAGLGFAGVFLLRASLGYVPAWRRRHCEQPFARLDCTVYAPLCLALGAAFLVLAWKGF